MPIGAATIAESRRLLILTALLAGEKQEMFRTVGPLVLELIKRTATRAGRLIQLLPREFALLDYLAQSADELVTYEMLFRRVWNYCFVPKDTNLLRVHIGNLRRKIDPANEWPMLRIERGAGVMLVSRPSLNGSGALDGTGTLRPGHPANDSGSAADLA